MGSSDSGELAGALMQMGARSCAPTWKTRQ
jgi:hypothetical protein